MRVVSVSRQLPNLQLFDAVWWIALSELEACGQGVCAKYIQDTDFTEATVDNIAKHIRSTSDTFYHLIQHY